MSGGGARSDRPRISVITTTYRTPPALLAESLGSILVQTFDELELIVVADGELGDDPRTVIDELAHDPRLVLLSPGRVGRAEALNLGLATARAPLIAIHDADDASHEERLERQVRVLDQRADIGLLGAGVRRSATTVDGARWPLPPPPSRVKMLDRQLLIGNPLVHSSIVVRRTALEAVGGYSVNRRYQFDHDLYLRMRGAGGGVGRLTEPLVLKRVHGDQVFEAKGPFIRRLVSAWRLQVDHARDEPAPQRYVFMGAASVRFGARVSRSTLRRMRAKL